MYDKESQRQLHLYASEITLTLTYGFLKLYNNVITVVKATSACPVNLFAIVPDGKPFLPKKF